MFNLNLKSDTDCELKTGAWYRWLGVGADMAAYIEAVRKPDLFGLTGLLEVISGVGDGVIQAGLYAGLRAPVGGCVCMGGGGYLGLPLKRLEQDVTHMTS